jgi:hypothetical protein
MNWKLNDLRKAEKSYCAAVQLHTDFANEWNNLAQVLWERSDKVAAPQPLSRR